MKRPLCVFGAGFLTTIAVAFVCPGAVAPLLAAVAGAGLIHPRNRRVGCVLLAASAAALGRMALVDRQLVQLQMLEGQQQTGVGYVCRVSPWNPSRLLIRVKLSNGGCYGVWLDAASQDFMPGDWLRATIHITGAREDTQDFFFTGGWVLSALPVEAPEAEKPQWPSPLAHMASVREQLLHKARLHSSGSGTHVVTGLLFSADEELPDEDRRAMEQAGISHLLSVSGFHMSLVLGWTAMKAPRSRLKRGLRLLLCLGLVFLVLSLAGYGAAAMRAGILGLMTVLAGCLNRRSDPWTSLCLSALLLITFSPALITDAGVQLSFCATAGIFAFSRLFRGLWEDGLVRLLGGRCPALCRSFCGCMGMLMAAQVSAAPVLALRFGTVPLLSAPLNLLILPLVYLSMALGGAGIFLLATPLAGAGALLLDLASLCGEGILILAKIWCRLPGCTLSTVWPGRFLLLGLLGALIFTPLLPVPRLVKRRLLVILTVVLLLTQGALSIVFENQVQLLALSGSSSLLLRWGQRQVVISGAGELWQLRQLEEELLSAGVVHPDVLICGRGGPDLLLEASRTISPRCLAAPEEDLSPVKRLMPASLRTVELGKQALPVGGISVERFDGDLVEVRIGQTKVLKCWGGYAIMDFDLLLGGTQEGALVSDREGRLWLRPGMISLPRSMGVRWVLAGSG